MGRNYKANFAKKKRDRKQKGKEEAPKYERPAAYEEIVKENEKFARYYKHMKICPDNEWDSFIETLKSDLPTTFRISSNQNSIEAKKLLNIVENQFFKNFLDEETAEDFGRPFPLPWYPNNLAWQMNVTRKNIRRSENLYRLHNFLVAETEAGGISRQEAVSMIPPLVLDVKPHHKVLDTCAAPGSKTAQIIEALHADGNGIPSGFVIANDVNNSRCYMLVHQAKRLNTPCFIVTNQDSCCMPKFRSPDGKALKFDRILCDVPCSGDGTLRKNPDIWKRWHLANALNLHGVQYRIIRRGVELLDVGGRLVYSTCSLNPVENEAVLHRLLKDSEGALELVDIAHHVPGLKYVPGINYWEVSDKDINEFYRSFDDVPVQYQTTIRPQMFPPAAEDAEKFALNRCIRVLPHLQNTGGFFVAALTKKRLLPWERSTEEKTVVQSAKNGDNAEASESSSEPQAKKKKVNYRFQGYNEDPFVFFQQDEPVWKQIKSFYDIDDTFNPTQLLTRSIKGKKKNLYFCSDAVKQFVQANEKNVKLINTGIKVFARCDHRDMQCEFRMVNEGLESINHMIGKKRRIEVTKDDMVTLLSCTDAKNPTEHEKLSERAREQMNGMVSGSCVLVLNDNNGLNLNVIGWKGAKSLRAYIDLHDSVHLLRLLDADVSKFEVNKFNKNAEEKESKDEKSLLIT